MNALPRRFTRHLAAAAVAVAIVAGAGSAALAAADATPMPPAAAEWAKHRQEWIGERLDHVANRLEIKASQQDAWQAFAKSVQALAPGQRMPPAAAGDAAAMVRSRADAAAEKAKKLAQIADATAKLQSILTPEQRTTFDQVVRETLGHAGWRHHEHDGPMRGGHEHCSPHGDGHVDRPGESRP